MPTYEYECTSCGHVFDLFQQMSESVKRKCPKCHKRALQRRVGIGAGVLFKGAGFYETDYRSDSYKKAAEADKKSAEGKTDDAKKDGKPAADSTKPADTTPAQTSSGANERKRTPRRAKSSSRKKR